MDQTARTIRARAAADKADTKAADARADYYREVVALVADVGASEAARRLGVARTRVYELLAKAKRT